MSPHPRPIRLFAPGRPMQRVGPSRRVRAIVLALLVAGASGCALLERSSTLLERRAALQDPGRMPWAFSHMSELFPSRTISRASGGVPTPRAPVDLSGVAFDTGAGELRGLDAHFEANHLRGLVVLHDGRLVFERYAEDVDATTRFTSWSVAKSFTSTLVGLALAEGAIASLDDPVERYLPEAAGTGYEGVTIRQALQMSSGVDFSEVYTLGTADVMQFMTDSLVLNREPANEAAIDYPRAHEPGTTFNYNTAETQVLGAVVVAATGRSLSALLQEKIWRRIDMQHDATWLLDRDGPEAMEMAGCCLNMTLRDQARFGQLFLQDGMWGGERVLPQGWVAEATVPIDAHLRFPEPDGDALPAERGYQYQWWWLGGDVYTAEGVYGQLIWIDPARRVVIAQAATWPEAWNEQLGADAFRMLDAIAEHLAASGAAGQQTAASER